MSTKSAVTTILESGGNVAGVINGEAGTIKSGVAGDSLGAGIATLDALQSFAGLMAIAAKDGTLAKLGGSAAGAGVSALSLANNVANARKEMIEPSGNGHPSDTTLASIGSDLRQAASMTTAEGATLLGTLDQFATTTRAADNDELTLKVAA